MQKIALLSALALVTGGCTAATPSSEAPAPDANEATISPLGAATPTSPAAVVPTVLPDGFRAVGTEPFWAVHVADGKLRYTTPQDQEGVLVEVHHTADLAGEAGLAGTMDGRTLRLVGKAEPCSDGMSDREYPFSVILELGEEQFKGCAWSLDSGA
ncbi:hypothetical protein RM533_11190 [Croceicoccus sp. F390]|uniref:Lipoprotein n=1 Tax=Croceicoccus esteveae TaxID=3075597 RepID=A0ABU2ZJF6_9SPHN|nr:hypothetical protein [Croceicoccus sp. F390]MDT0576740.1 hypothetical protein [Croceicoccus sp. F390]